MSNFFSILKYCITYLRLLTSIATAITRNMAITILETDCNPPLLRLLIQKVANINTAAPIKKLFGIHLPCISFDNTTNEKPIKKTISNIQP